MNPVTFNDFFKRMAATKSWRDCQRELRWPTIEQVCAAPLFLHDADQTIAQKLRDFGKENLLDMVFDERLVYRLPFPIVRAAFESKESRSSWHVVMFDSLGGSHEGAAVPVTTILWHFARMEGRNPSLNPPGTMKLAVIHTASRDHSQGRDVAGGVTFLDSTRGFGLVPIPDEEKYEFAESHQTMLLGFLFDVLSPSNHLAKVCPERGDKSAQWQAAREHFVILDRRHAANRAEVATGTRIAHDAGRNSERIAHSRRAHWRTFRSERYRAAKGRRTWIKSLWVGPRVWRDMAGSIYQIIR